MLHNTKLTILLLSVLLLSCEERDVRLADSPESTEPAVVHLSAEEDTVEFSAYIEMPDGVLLAAQIYLPDEHQQLQRVPAIVEFTRYWRATEMLPPHTNLSNQASYSLAAGYAYVVIDVRGSGASQGVRKAEFSLAEARDMPYVIDWMASQTWSNGKVASMGVSYPGNTAEMAALFRSPALVAAVPRFTDFDWYTSIVVPGGLKNSFITERWGAAVRKMDLNDATLFGEHIGEPSMKNPRPLGVLPVASDTDRSILSAASASHSANSSLADQLATLVYRDEYPMSSSLKDSGNNATSIHRSQSRYEQIALPMYQWGSWFDASTAAGILARFTYWDTPYKYIIGAWSHGAGYDANPYAEQNAPPQPSMDEQYADIFAFLDPLMKQSGSGEPPAKELTYFTVGENAWKTTRVWPPAGQVMERWYLQADNALAQQPPQLTDGVDEYAVDFEAGTGSSSRWATQLGGGDVYYQDRSAADQRLLSYTSAPLTSDMEITGSAVISLQVSSTHEDGAFIVYLEDVAPDGHVRMLTEGQLRAVHREVKEKQSFASFGPFHTFERKDGQKMVPGEITNISFVLLPVSALLRQGHAIRIAIAGHDKDTFVRVPESGKPIIQLYRGQSALSWIDLPVIRNE
jgi:putative CocE/NonD family hydrolase